MSILSVSFTQLNPETAEGVGFFVLFMFWGFIALWSIYWFISVPIYLARIAKNTKRMADKMDLVRK